MRASPTMLVAAVPLALWGAWALWMSFRGHQWVVTALACLAFVTVAGLLFLKWWARYLAYAFAVWLSVSWFYTVWYVMDRAWPYTGMVRTVLSLLPGLLWVVVCAVGAYVVHREYRRHP